MKLSERHHFLILFFLALIILLGWNNVISLRAEEPRRAIVSLEMLLSGNYAVPKINGMSYYNKPPVFNWIMAGFFKVFGSSSENIVRLPSILSLFLNAWLIMLIVKRFLGRKTAYLASLFYITASNILFYGSVNAGEIDLFYTLIVFLQVISIFHFSEKNKPLQLFIFSYFFAIVGFLTKGLPSVVFQALTIFPWLIYQQKWRWLISWKHFVGIGVFIVLFLAYFFQYSQYDDPVIFITRLFKEASQKSGAEHPILKTIGSASTFPLFLLHLILPWGLLSVFLLKKSIRSLLNQNPLLKFSWVFTLYNIPIYWLSANHKARYLYIFLIFMAIIFAHLFVKYMLPENRKRWNLYINTSTIIIIITSVAFLSLNFIPELGHINNLTLKSIVFCLVGLSLAYGFFKAKNNNVFLLIAFVLVLRLGMNIFYLPSLQKTENDLQYSNTISEVIKITGESPIIWLGGIRDTSALAKIGPFKIKKVRIVTAPLMAYQIPYYITKSNNHILEIEPTLEMGKFYLTIDSDYPKVKKAKELYRFRDSWMQKELILFTPLDTALYEPL